MADAPTDSDDDSQDNDDEQIRIVRVLIEGRVQGVWFRAWACEKATGIGLDGWVRNRKSGRVEAVFSGPFDLVDEMVAACFEGPSLARVEGVETEEMGGMHVAPGFHQWPTT